MSLTEDLLPPGWDEDAPDTGTALASLIEAGRRFADVIDQEQMRYGDGMTTRETRHRLRMESIDGLREFRKALREAEGCIQ